MTSEVLKQKSFPDEQYDRCFCLLDNLIIIAVKSFALKIIEIYICGYLLEIIQAKIIHPGQHYVLRKEALMLVEKINKGDATSAVHFLPLSSRIKFLHYFF